MNIPIDLSLAQALAVQRSIKAEITRLGDKVRQDAMPKSMVLEAQYSMKELNHVADQLEDRLDAYRDIIDDYARDNGERREDEEV